MGYVDAVRTIQTLINTEGLDTTRKAFAYVLKINPRVNPEREKRKRVSLATARRIYGRQKGHCPICGQVMAFVQGEYEVDHINPNEQNFNAESNLQVVHPKCNREKSSKALPQLAKESGRTIREMLPPE